MEEEGAVEAGWCLGVMMGKRGQRRDHEGGLGIMMNTSETRSATQSSDQRVPTLIFKFYRK